MCAEPLVTLFAIIGVGVVVTQLAVLGCDGMLAALDWLYGEEMED